MKPKNTICLWFNQGRARGGADLALALRAVREVPVLMKDA
jgi:hypothetical protein